jgi:hypothetical protein
MSTLVTVETYANAKVMAKVVAYVRQDRYSRKRVEGSSQSFPIGGLPILSSLKTIQDTNYDFQSYSLYKHLIHLQAPHFLKKRSYNTSHQLSIQSSCNSKLNLRSVIDLQPLSESITMSLCMRIPAYLPQDRFRTLRLLQHIRESHKNRLPACTEVCMRNDQNWILQLTSKWRKLMPNASKGW